MRFCFSENDFQSTGSIVPKKKVIHCSKKKLQILIGDKKLGNLMLKFVN